MISDSINVVSVEDEEIEKDALEEILIEQQTAWKDATYETQIDTLESSHPIDNQI